MISFLSFLISIVRATVISFLFSYPSGQQPGALFELSKTIATLAIFAPPSCWPLPLAFLFIRSSSFVART